MIANSIVRQSRFLALTAAHLCNLLLFPGLATAAPSVPKEVLAFFYGWYGDPANHADWRGVDIPKASIANTADYPISGPYKSDDAAFTRKQLQQMKDSGITGLIYSWWGIATYEDQHLPMVISEASSVGLKVTVYYESSNLPGQDLDEHLVEQDFNYILQKYGSAPNWLRVDNKDVIFVYGRPLASMPAAAWRRVFGRVRQRPGGAWFSVASESAKDLDFVDGIHRYALVANVQHRDPEAASKWMLKFSHDYLAEQSHYRVRTLTVYPGYDDTHLTRKNRLRTGRFDGKLYESLWLAAIAADPDWILITSWNEWHEGTEVEPSLEYGDTYLRLTSRYCQAFLGK